MLRRDKRQGQGQGVRGKMSQNEDKGGRRLRESSAGSAGESGLFGALEMSREEANLDDGRSITFYWFTEHPEDD